MKSELAWIEQAMRYLSKEISGEDFEKYVNEIASIEAEMEPDDYLELLSRNYGRKDYRREVGQLVRKYFGEMATEVAEVKFMLKSIVSGVGDPAEVICALYNKMGKHIYVYDLAIHTVLGVDEVPRLSEKNNWNGNDFDKARRWFDEALPRFKKIAQTILDAFENGSLIIRDDEVIRTSEFLEAMKEFDIRKSGRAI